MAVTLKQIAEKVGVSIPTVSRVINGRESGVKVHEDTQQRILTVAAELGYKPNLLARGLVGSKSSLIGVIVRDISDPYLNKVLKGMHDAAIDHQHRLFLGHIGQRADTTIDYGSMFEQSHADGIIVMGDIRGDEEALQALTKQHKYVVGVTDRTKRRKFPGVYSDSEVGASLALEHLLSLGHQRIVCVTDPAISDGRLRAKVYERYMREQGLEKYLKVYKTSRSVKNGYQLGLGIFNDAERFTAILAATDTLALGLIKAAFERGVLVPADVSIVGYDDIDIAPYTVPALTTVSQSGHEMGYKTASLLLDMIQHELESSDVQDIVLTPELIIRESTALVKGD
ncbi:MAG: LacI family DNA-binding transcriptional regulator [Chitinophagaceae bacterium]|nr:LacI family DNA-binding transcriptional regulator [Anaerolineae bacterium]